MWVQVSSNFGASVHVQLFRFFFVILHGESFTIFQLCVHFFVVVFYATPINILTFVIVMFITSIATSAATSNTPSHINQSALQSVQQSQKLQSWLIVDVRRRIDVRFKVVCRRLSDTVSD